MRRFVACLAAILAIAVVAPVLAEDHMSADVALGAGFDSNIGNTPSGNSVRSQTVLGGGVAAAWRIDQGTHTAWQLRGSLNASAFAPTSDLSEAQAAVRLRWMHRPGNGFFTPLLAAWVSAGGRGSGSDLRNGSDYRAGGFLRQQLTTAVSGRLGYEFSKRVSQSDVFDLVGRTITLSFDWIAGPTWTWYAELEHHGGQIVTSVVDEDDLIAPRLKSYHYVLPAAEAIEEDEAYGDNWFAVKVPATGNALAVGFNRPLWGSWALDSRLRYALFTVGDSSHGYSRGQLDVTFLRRF